MGDVSRQQSELLDYHVRELNTDGPRRLNARELTQHVSAYVARTEVAVYARRRKQEFTGRHCSSG